MPGRGGFDLLEELEAAENPPPVLVLTATRLEETAKEARARGAADCLRKPFEVEALRRRVRDLLASAELRAPRPSGGAQRRALHRPRWDHSEPPRQAAGAAALLFQAFGEIRLRRSAYGGARPPRFHVLAIDAATKTVLILGPHLVAAVAPAGHLVERLELGFGLPQRRLRVTRFARRPAPRPRRRRHACRPRGPKGTPPRPRGSAASAGGDRSARGPRRRALRAIAREERFAVGSLALVELGRRRRRRPQTRRRQHAPGRITPSTPRDLGPVASPRAPRAPPRSPRGAPRARAPPFVGERAALEKGLEPRLALAQRPEALAPLRLAGAAGHVRVLDQREHACSRIDLEREVVEEARAEQAHRQRLADAAADVLDARFADLDGVELDTA